MVEEVTGTTRLPIPADATHHFVDVIRRATEVLTSPTLASAYVVARCWDLIWPTDALEVLEPKGTVRTYARNP
ncbi:hypothetical protein NKG05_16420 [Oerskovia sp. M15]